MKTQRFQVQVIGRKGGGITVPIPFDPDQVWGTKARHDITGSVGPCSVRGPLDKESGAYFLHLGPAATRGMVPLDRDVTIILSPEGPQIDEMSEDLQQAFASSPRAKEFFEGLATFYRKNFIRSIEDAKRPATRSARITEMISLLEAGKREK